MLPPAENNATQVSVVRVGSERLGKGPEAIPHDAVPDSSDVYEHDDEEEAEKCSPVPVSNSVDETAGMPGHHVSRTREDKVATDMEIDAPGLQDGTKPTHSYPVAAEPESVITLGNQDATAPLMEVDDTVNGEGFASYIPERSRCQESSNISVRSPVGHLDVDAAGSLADYHEPSIIATSSVPGGIPTDKNTQVVPALPGKIHAGTDVAAPSTTNVKEAGESSLGPVVDASVVNRATSEYCNDEPIAMADDAEDFDQQDIVLEVMIMDKGQQRSFTYNPALWLCVEAALPLPGDRHVHFILVAPAAGNVASILVKLPRRAIIQTNLPATRGNLTAWRDLPGNSPMKRFLSEVRGSSVTVEDNILDEYLARLIPKHNSRAWKDVVKNSKMGYFSYSDLTTPRDVGRVLQLFRDPILTMCRESLVSTKHQLAQGDFDVRVVFGGLCSETSHVQAAHVDFPFEVLAEYEKRPDKEVMLLFGPLSPAGMHLQVWVENENGDFEPRIIYLKRGQLLMLPASTIHAGGFRSGYCNLLNLRLHGYVYISALSAVPEVEHKTTYIGQSILKTPHHEALTELPLTFEASLP
jgi:hypothetical protein